MRTPGLEGPPGRGAPIIPLNNSDVLLTSRKHCSFGFGFYVKSVRAVVPHTLTFNAQGIEISGIQWNFCQWRHPEYVPLVRIGPP